MWKNGSICFYVRILPILFWGKIEERPIDCCLNCPNMIFLICWWWICLEDLLYIVASDETLLISILWNCGERSKGSKVTFGKCPTWGICRMVHWTFQRCKYWSKIAQIHPFIQTCRSLERKICSTTPHLEGGGRGGGGHRVIFIKLLWTCDPWQMMFLFIVYLLLHNNFEEKYVNAWQSENWWEIVSCLHGPRAS